MSESEEDIWRYKSIRKKRTADRHVQKTSSHEKTQKVKRSTAKKTGVTRNTTGAENNKSPSKNGIIISPVKERSSSASGTGGEDLSSPKRTLKKESKKASPSTPKEKHSGYCPSCQMPFSVLLVQTPRWHVMECLDTPSCAQTECPDGLTCSSTIAYHYKRYSHFLLAQSRAAELSPFPPVCTPDLPSPDAAKSCIPNGRNDTKFSHSQGAFTKKTTQVKSSRSQSPASSQGSVKQTSLDAWLSSPTKLSQNSLDLSQEDPSQKCASFVNAATSLGLSQKDEAMNDCAISYSPLVSDQELFSDDEDLPAGPVKRLFSSKLPADPVENIEEISAAEIFITKSGIKSPTKCNGIHSDTSAINSQCAQRNGVTCVADCSIDGDKWSECSTPGSEVSEWATTQQEAECWSRDEAGELLVCSADGDREAAPLRDSGEAVIVQKAFYTSSQRSTQPFTTNRTHTRESLTQPASTMPLSRAVPSKGMKQMDIGVFFGLKPKAK
ncbi:unnamed protein product [Staurois parvus]|uniref:UBZ4-type domain-containing protein n=1 Tax=Staurois parvus TaxID=386267 RepID=A0ABN9AGI4_9NEOB|nr:unnamed protein product [Staurois parvus]